MSGTLKLQCKSVISVITSFRSSSRSLARSLCVSISSWRCRQSSVLDCVVEQSSVVKYYWKIEGQCWCRLRLVISFCTNFSLKMLNLGRLRVKLRNLKVPNTLLRASHKFQNSKIFRASLGKPCRFGIQA